MKFAAAVVILAALVGIECSIIPLAPALSYTAKLDCPEGNVAPKLMPSSNGFNVRIYIIIMEKVAPSQLASIE
ncbi:unnamed protein product [Hermetia illucens]|uniref:Uncharacterized protein n=1 Tax=Hermetia illucens TaxID=343691 RepID=A0A7R8UER3_HERIL|nr:unnamed protein product [Hermetia illucens]